MAMHQDKVKVLYIGGCGRSGSTLLLRMLGQIDGFFAAGELWNIWQRSFIENELCGCGARFNECDIWKSVAEEAFGGFQHIELDAICALKQNVQSNFNLPMLVFRFLRTSNYQKAFESYIGVLNRLYGAIQKVSGSRVIVDSSKGPRYAYTLSQIPKIDLYIVHLIRDGRAVAYSWKKKKLKPEVYGKTAYMDRPGLIRSAINWDIVNLLFQANKHASLNYMMVSYEDLIGNTRTCCSRILEFLAEDGLETSLFQSECTVQLGINHTAVGNPNRFQRGLIELRVDAEWQRRMTRGQKSIVTALTWPLLYRYGYLGDSNGALKERDLG